MDIKTFNTLAPKLPTSIAILLRGATGVGKSHIVHEMANKLGLPVVDVRGSTMDESKVTGIADFEASREFGVSTFVLPSWFIRAHREPVVLFLDELNRSNPQVQQAFFQVVLDRALGNDTNGMPVKLHPETRVVAAVNFGAQYDVNDMDPALLRRFWVQDLTPTTEDWIAWASDPQKGNIDPLIVDFIRENAAHLHVDVEKVTPGEVFPTPASWARLDQSIKSVYGEGLIEQAGAPADLLTVLASGFVGSEAMLMLLDYVARYKRNLTIEDILNRRYKASDISKMKKTEATSIVDKLVEHGRANDWSDDNAESVVDFVRLLPEENMVHLWLSMLEKEKGINSVTLHALHKHMGGEVCDLIAASHKIGKA